MSTDEGTTPQASIGSGFGFESTAEEVIKGIDLTGKVVVVTGGYAGLGLETTRVLSGAGATVIVPARDLVKAQKLVDGIPRVELAALDLMNPESINAFAKSFLESKRPLDVLINNAGVMMNPLTRDSRGYESQFSTNHLGHFHLTARLWPALLRSKAARVINLSSFGHTFSPVDLDDPNFERRNYNKTKAYGQSKTANILFTVALDKRGKPHNVRAFAVHPGIIFETDLTRHLPSEYFGQRGIEFNENRTIKNNPGIPVKNIPQGASTTVWCATSPQLNGKGGVYCEDCDVTPVTAPDESIAVGKVTPYAIDPITAESLWKLSEQLTKVTFNTNTNIPSKL